MKKGQVSKQGGIENILFPMAVLNITQGNDVGTHRGTYAVDLAGKDQGIDAFYAPFSVICKAIDAVNGNAVWWESQNKVRFADGTIDHATILVIHSNDITKLKVGAKYAQGMQISQEGTAGFATGNHIHFEIAKGKYRRQYVRNAFGVYHLPNNMSIEKACFIDDTILKGAGAKWSWKKTTSLTNTMNQPDVSILNTIPSDFIKESAVFTVGVAKLIIRKAPSKKGQDTGLTYNRGMRVRYDGYVKREGYVWISWISASSKERRWMAIREIATNRLYGSIQ